ncbi:hypothetical protein EB796_024680 [Bugula neritina]|uniref:Uncharacterized protein n=1 Tax=Bugula neritina TaxID=10212 RepID=A0A7J7IUD2_BUGNE|nr:hypothetical protein EB796_024680 [Bugula neritina]
MMKWVNCLCSLCGLKMGTSEVLGSPASSILASPPPAENHIVAPNPPIRQDSIQLTVDLPAQKTLSNQSLVNEDLSNQILDEIEAREKGHMVVEDRSVEDSEQLGYTELSECTTGHNGNGEFIELYDVPNHSGWHPLPG